jgi:hypothetical protein
MITLNGKEIRELAEFVGLMIVDLDYSDELETEVTIAKCPSGGVCGDDGKYTKYEYVAYLSEYPEEGVMPLGDEK